VMTRGMPVIERMLDDKLPMTSGPQWLYQNVLKTQDKVIAIAGTHGKTTTTSLAAWIFEDNGHDPGFLIGGVPGNFDVSARLGVGRVFVIEADEYDSAFFDKRSKFIHYRPDILVLNNLEFDHADIFNSLEDIQRQFHHLLKLVPQHGHVLANGDDAQLSAVIEKGIWSGLDYFGSQPAHQWQMFSQNTVAFTLAHQDTSASALTTIPGIHNQMNALAAIAACNKAGIGIEDAIRSLASFKPPRRRLELKFSNDEISVYDDFAHHPTAIAHTIKTVKAGNGRSLSVVFEPRSNSMRSGAHNNGLKTAFAQADEIILYQPAGNETEFDFLENVYGRTLTIHSQIDHIIEHLNRNAVKPRDVIFMSNGGFDNIVNRFVDTLRNL